MSIEYYLIHCDEHIERLEYIRSIQTKLPIKLFKGIYTKDVKIKEQNEFIKNFNSNINTINCFYQSGQIGCYLSHFSLVEHIMKESKTEYSVVFEDDVKFKDNLNDEIIKITQKLKDLSIDFDILFLGNLVGNKGEPIIDNIFHMDKKNQCTGTHALLIKNKNIKKIFNVNCHVKGAIDNHYTACNKNNELICLVLSPSICYQYGFISNINI